MAPLCPRPHRDAKGRCVLTDLDDALHLEKTGQRSEGKGRVVDHQKGETDVRKGCEVNTSEAGVVGDDEGSADVGQKSKVNACKHAVVVNVEITLCECQHGVDQGGDWRIKDAPISEDDRAA